MSEHNRVAFYDFDGTLASSNVVTRCAYLVRNQPAKVRAILKYTKLVLEIPLWIGLNLYSRRLFNKIFYREYQGMEKDCLQQLAEPLFENVILPTVYLGAKPLIDADRKNGFRLVLISGALDFALGPVVRYFGFDEVICNQLIYQDGIATGEIAPPLIAENEKVTAMQKSCQASSAEMGKSKAYSDSSSDLPMLEAVGEPIAVNPDCRLKKVAIKRGWSILDLRKGSYASNQ